MAAWICGFETINGTCRSSIENPSSNRGTGQQLGPALILRHTKGASAAFIKEFMRRSAQYLVQENKTPGLRLHHVESALHELLFSGGSLNVKLPGGAFGGRGCQRPT